MNSAREISSLSKYVLINAARNEKEFIEKTLKSVVSQSLLPRKWVIVSDGSTDGTNEIAGGYTERHAYINLRCIGGQGKRNFASKVFALREGIKELEGLDYDFMGNVDADVSFETNYFEKLIGKFNENRRLGVADGTILEANRGECRERAENRSRNVAEAIQMFHRQCFEEIGGFLPLKEGVEDTMAKIMAQIKGWEVRTFKELSVLHYRQTGRVGSDVWRMRYRQGIEDYMLGYHGLFFVLKCLGRVLEKPYILGSVLRMLGYAIAEVRRTKRQVPDSVLRFHREEQMERLKAIIGFKKIARILRDGWQH